MNDNDKNSILVRVTDDGIGAETQDVPQPPAGRGAEQQALWSRKRAAKDVSINVETLREGIEKITAKLEEVFQARQAPQPDRPFELKSFTVGLAVNGSGKVLLVGEIGAEASIQVTFERRGA